MKTQLAEFCPLPITNPRRAYVSADNTDVAETIRQHEPIRVCSILDDYELTDRLGYLEQLGAFK